MKHETDEIHANFMKKIKLELETLEEVNQRKYINSKDVFYLH